MLLAKGCSYEEILVDAQENSASRALTVKNFISVIHVMLDILIRRLLRNFY